MMREDFAACREMYQRDGYVTMKDAVTPEALAAMRTQLDIWADESRQHDAPYGQIMDGRPRFDVEPATHGPDTPALRRITSPIEISDDFLAVARDNAALDLLAEVMSPNIKLQASKVNLKLPGSGTNVRYHQDFPFEPHSNDDLCTVLIFLDDVTLDNGPLEVVPGTHRGELYTLWHDGVFTGAVDHSVEATHR
ncbi:MAG TPA: restriction endonuclease subunit S, partial [Alphaproteobacteria bacterium]|nr:restriction endonuclease subunit S [Alphaproteobacteria bacterium]